MVKSHTVKSQKTGDRVRASHEVKGRHSAGSPQQGRRTIFAGLRNSLSRLSKSPSHEDLRHETSDTTAAAAVATDVADHNDEVNDDDDDDDDSKVKGSSERGSEENVAVEPVDTSELECQQRQHHSDAIPAQPSDSAAL